MRKSNFYFGIVIIGILVYGFFRSQNSSKLLNEFGVYTIAVIVKVESGTGRGCVREVSLNFIFNGIKYAKKLCSGKELSTPLIGKRIFIKINSHDIERSLEINYNCFVPDSLTSAPPKGWDSVWMKKHFSDCIK